MNIETKELGAGSYPEEPETKEKCYQFDFSAICSGYGYVYAKSQSEARKRVLDNDYDEIIDQFDLKIKEITRIEEE